MGSWRRFEDRMYEFCGEDQRLQFHVGGHGWMSLLATRYEAWKDAEERYTAHDRVRRIGVSDVNVLRTIGILYQLQQQDLTEEV